MANKSFRSDSAFWGGIAKLSDVLGLSVLFVFCSLPLFTIGASLTALYDVTVHCVRGGESGPYSRFFSTFKNEFKFSSLVSLLWIGIWGVLYLLYSFVITGANAGVPFMIVLKYAYPLLGIIPAGVTCWLFPLLSRFTQSFKTLNASAFRVTFAYLPQTLLCVLIAAACITACVLWLLPLVILPCVMMLLFSLVMEPVMQKLPSSE